MNSNYFGNFPFNRTSIISNAPKTKGVYYCGILGSNGFLIPLYIGRAKGQNVTIQSRLLDHLNNKDWFDVISFGYYICLSETEAETFEKNEILRFGVPRYNKKIV